MKQSERELLEGARRYDLDALAEIYDRYSPGLYQYAFRLTGDANLAEDCVAETFFRLLRAFQNGQGPESFLQAYLYRIAHNWINDLYRRQPPPPLDLDESHHAEAIDGPELQAEQRLLREEMRAALFRLTPEQRQVVMLRFVEGWENEAIASALQKPVGAVKALQHRALAALRRIFQTDSGKVRNERKTISQGLCKPGSSSSEAL